MTRVVRIFLLLILLIFPRGVWSSSEVFQSNMADQFVLDVSNNIMEEVVDGILALQNKYQELKAFNKEIFQKGKLVKRTADCKVQCSPYELTEIKYDIDGLRIWISFTPFSCHKGDSCNWPPTKEIYIHSIGQYLDNHINSQNNPALKEDLIKVMLAVVERHNKSRK
ncbi:MAG: hypothetical protein HQL15_09100 [Candidatus Omnitrophica bacterium]|nr:hypothetical protein [Candidatus Omnitrophota bacterium]